jgi:hypothetical protein
VERVTWPAARDEKVFRKLVMGSKSIRFDTERNVAIFRGVEPG